MTSDWNIATHSPLPFVLKEIKIASHSISIWPVVTNVFVESVDAFVKSVGRLETRACRD